MTSKEVAKLLGYARTEKDRRLHAAFPFLTGMRASEQLGLLWEDVGFARNIIAVRRVLERDGATTDQSKTEARTVASNIAHARLAVGNQREQRSTLSR